MSVLDDILRDIPGPAQETIRQAWDGLPAARQRELEGWLAVLPEAIKPLKEILALVADQYRPIAAARQRIAVVGPANVGKSTLYNQLITHAKDRAEVGPVPGTTRRTQEADTGLFAVIDTPGADAAGEVGEAEREIALAAAAEADFLLLVFEATRGIKRYEKELFDTLVALQKPFVVILNKIDLVPKAERERVIQAAAQTLNLQRGQVIDTVATTGANLGRVILAVVKAEPGLVAAIADALPEYRSRLTWARIVPAGGAAATVALMPLPLADVVPLLALQTGLVLSISRIYGFHITPGRAKELIVTFGVGLLARRAFAELSKLGGVPGWLLSAAIAASTTVAIGTASMAWFARGERPTQAALARQMADISAYLRSQLADLGQRRPDERSLRKRVGDALAGLPRHLRPGENG